jgi:hypothetical protein
VSGIYIGLLDKWMGGRMRPSIINPFVHLDNYFRFRLKISELTAGI